MTSEQFMRKAIEEARAGVKNGQGIGFGSVIVKDDKLISAAHDDVSVTKDPTSHAEVNAIREACRVLDTPNLAGCTLYTTCEPCPMCFTAAWWANIDHIVFGAYLGDVTHISIEMVIDSEILNEKGGSRIKIEKGFLRDECLELYKQH